MKPIVLAAAVLASAQSARAQQASFTYMLGRDTIAVEQFTHTASQQVGDLVSRQGAFVVQLHYDVALGRNGRPLTALYRIRNASGSMLSNQPTEIRLVFGRDSVKREAVYADSTVTRTLPAVNATPLISPAYSLYEIPLAQLRKLKLPVLTVTAVGTGANTPGTITLTAGDGDTVRDSNGAILHVDRQGHVLAVDLSGTTNKLMAERASDGHDIAAIAGTMKPIGTLSPRGTAHGSFMQSVVFIDYGRPQVRGRTVWGGLLVPPDTIWRAGANEATHLATSRELTFGNVVVPPGLYTLWIYNSSRNGPQLVINRQIGQWGAGPGVYDEKQDLGRIPMTMANAPEPIEDFTITIRPSGPGRGAIDFGWGDKIATATFAVHQ